MEVAGLGERVQIGECKGTGVTEHKKVNNTGAASGAHRLER
jgi:hypothetical protein